MIEWEIKIRQADNGYFLTGYTTGKEGNIELDREIVIEEEDQDEYDEQRTMRKLLWEVMNYFGVSRSKHNKINCVINLEDENGKILE